VTEANIAVADRIERVDLDPLTIPEGPPDQRHDRLVAIFDLVEENVFRVKGREAGPYWLLVSSQETKLTFEGFSSRTGERVCNIVVSTTPLRSLLRVYAMVCQSYYSAIRNASPRQIEQIDRERTAIHTEGANLILERFGEEVDIDLATARRIFTLVTTLYRTT